MQRGVGPRGRTAPPSVSPVPSVVMPPAYASSDDIVWVRRYEDAVDVLRADPTFVTWLARDEAPFLEGVILKIDGQEHLGRRRVLNKLFRREAHQRYRQETLVPAIERRLKAVLDAPDADGVVRTDLVAFSSRVFLDMAVALTGFDGADTPEGHAELARLVEAIRQGREVVWSKNPSEAMTTALAAREVFRRRFYEPSLRRRRELVAQRDAGEIDGGDPADLMMLVALGADPAWDDEELALRSVLGFLGAGTNTSTMVVPHMIDELEAWFAAHQEDYQLRTDPAFLSGAVSEALRLHVVSPALVRAATRTMNLSSGLEVRRGQRVMLDLGAASRDPEVYGPNADTFDPRRTVPPGKYRYGLAFGSGPHMCMGMPLVLGVQGSDGSHVQLLAALYAAGIRRDPHRPAIKAQDARDKYERYPVVFASDDSPTG